MPEISRRDWIAMAGALAAFAPAPSAAEQTPQPRVVSKGRLKQSACRWCYRDIPLPALAKAAAEMGLPALDLVDEVDWPILAEHGLVCSMGWKTGRRHPRRPERPAQPRRDREGPDRRHAPRAKAAVPNLIAFFGNRKGMSDADGIKNCVAGLKRVKKAGRGARHHRVRGAAQQQGRPQGLPVRPHAVGRRGRAAGRVAARQAALRHLPHADHGGRRHPHDPRQPPVDRPLPHGRRARPPRDRRHPGAQLAGGGAAIADTGFKGYMAHEFVPTRDPLTSLREAIALCDV